MFNYEIGCETDDLAWYKEAKYMNYPWAVTLYCKLLSLLFTI